MMFILISPFPLMLSYLWYHSQIFKATPPNTSEQRVKYSKKMGRTRDQRYIVNQSLISFEATETQLNHAHSGSAFKTAAQWLLYMWWILPVMASNGHSSYLSILVKRYCHRRQYFEWRNLLTGYNINFSTNFQPLLIPIDTFIFKIIKNKHNIETLKHNASPN